MNGYERRPWSLVMQRANAAVERAIDAFERLRDRTERFMDACGDARRRCWDRGLSGKLLASLLTVFTVTFGLLLAVLIWALNAGACVIVLIPAAALGVMRERTALIIPFSLSSTAHLALTAAGAVGAFYAGRYIVVRKTQWRKLKAKHNALWYRWGGLARARSSRLLFPRVVFLAWVALALSMLIVKFPDETGDAARDCPYQSIRGANHLHRRGCRYVSRTKGTILGWYADERCEGTEDDPVPVAFCPPNQTGLEYCKVCHPEDEVPIESATGIQRGSFIGLGFSGVAKTAGTLLLGFLAVRATKKTFRVDE
jgi:hypothetical protein